MRSTTKQPNWGNWYVCEICKVTHFEKYDKEYKEHINHKAKIVPIILSDDLKENERMLLSEFIY